MQIHDLTREPPQIHDQHGDQRYSAAYRIEDAVLAFLDAALIPAMQTIETGAGTSTVAFAIKQTQHTCIVPSSDQIARIRAYCAQHAIATAQIRFIPAPSQQVLPHLPPATFQLALIDGNHGFPSMFVDFYYVARALALDGLLIVDDLYIWTCAGLAEFLETSPAWHVELKTSRTLIVRKRAHGSEDGEWVDQPFVTRQSRATSRPASINYALGLLWRGEFTLFRENMASRLRR